MVIKAAGRKGVTLLW